MTDTDPSAATPPAASDRPRSGLTQTGVRKASAKPGRSRARGFALQGLYQHLVGGNASDEIDTFTRELSGFNKADAAHFDALLHGCIREASQLDAKLTPHLDRKVGELSPVEHGVLLIGTFELQYCMDVPYKVAINEAVELAKSFGGTDGHKYVNGVLDKAAADLRPAEVRNQRPRQPG